MTGLPEGAPRYSSSNPDVLARITEAWNSMPKDEKAQISEELIKESDEVREMKALSVQSVPISTFHDMQASLESVFETVRLNTTAWRSQLY